MKRFASRWASTVFYAGFLLFNLFLFAIMVRFLERPIIPCMVLFVLQGIVVYGTIRYSSRQLRHLVTKMDYISQGNDLEHKVEAPEPVLLMGNELQVLAGAINRMTDTLSGSYEAAQYFASDVSHNLRTPMAVILAQCEISLEEEMPEEIRRSLESINQQAVTMNNMIDSMLMFLRIMGTRSNYTMEDVNLSEVTDATCETFLLIGREDITLERSIEDDLHIMGNERLLYGLLENLITNAYKYGEEGGHIWVRLQSRENQLLLQVQDDGIGIPAQHLDKIFRRFYQVQPDLSQGGAGFGLAIVKVIAEIHDASVHVDSTLGEGSVFTVTFTRLGGGNAGESGELSSSHNP